MECRFELQFAPHVIVEGGAEWAGDGFVAGVVFLVLSVPGS